VGPEAPEPPEAVGSFCLLVLRPGHDPVRGAVGRARLESGAREPLGIGSPSLCLLVPGPWLASLAGQEPRARPEGAVDQEPKARGSPRAPGGSYG
jgi:hypothetical protein